MKRIMMMLALVAMTLTASAGDKKKAQTVKTVTFNVSMHCENCQKKIEGTIQDRHHQVRLAEDHARKAAERYREAGLQD